MLRLNYRATYTFSSLDIGDMADSEQIVYECWANRPSGWTAKCRDFFAGNDPATSVELALDIIGLSLISVSQGGKRWPVAGREGAEALREAIESQNPGYGDEFILNLAIAIFDRQTRRENERSKNSGEPSPGSSDGNGSENTNGRTAPLPEPEPAAPSPEN